MQLDERNATCQVFTYKEGALSAFGHDLELRVGHFTLEVEPASVSGSFDAGSLQVFAGISNGRAHPVSAGDRASIEKSVREEVLHSRRFPQIEFRSSSVSDGEIRGTLTLHGQRREIVCRRESPQIASVELQQPEFGIKPYRAMLGALRVRPNVLVRVSLERPLQF